MTGRMTGTANKARWSRASTASFAPGRVKKYRRPVNGPVTTSAVRPTYSSSAAVRPDVSVHPQLRRDSAELPAWVRTPGISFSLFIAMLDSPVYSRRLLLSGLTISAGSAKSRLSPPIVSPHLTSQNTGGAVPPRRAPPTPFLGALLHGKRKQEPKSYKKNLERHFLGCFFHSHSPYIALGPSHHAKAANPDTAFKINNLRLLPTDRRPRTQTPCLTS